MATVYIIQETLKKVEGQWRRVHDFTPALAYGDIEILIGGGQYMPLTMQPVISEIKEKLKKFCNDDFLLLVGDPVLMGIATCVAAEINCGKINFLRWDRDTQRYIKMSCDFRK